MVLNKKRKLLNPQMNSNVFLDPDADDEIVEDKYNKINSW